MYFCFPGRGFEWAQCVELSVGKPKQTHKQIVLEENHRYLQPGPVLAEICPRSWNRCGVQLCAEATPSVSLGKLFHIPVTLWIKHPLTGTVALNVYFFSSVVNCSCSVSLKAVINICILLLCLPLNVRFCSCTYWMLEIFPISVKVILNKNEWFILLQSMLLVECQRGFLVCTQRSLWVTEEPPD